MTTGREEEEEEQAAGTLEQSKQRRLEKKEIEQTKSPASRREREEGMCVCVCIVCIFVKVDDNVKQTLPTIFKFQSIRMVTTCSTEICEKKKMMMMMNYRNRITTYRIYRLVLQKINKNIQTTSTWKKSNDEHTLNKRKKN
ncbi:hypothetical protein Tsp_01632 [Trichinella spiralis]|uniref:hypothetical protein n=1 Tax=Trichinella spiralis TaxID=6334 RepID=UPI0001EFC484|nr:hypothetical protein Tsp_01632 [Trichinella spiralis]